MRELSPVVEGLTMIHRIISRGLNTSLRKCDEYLGKQGIPPSEAAGFSMYLSTLNRVTHSHHLSEDELAFPYFSEHLEAPYNKLKDDHQNIARVLVTLDQCLLEAPTNGVSKLREVLDEFNNLWVQHIKIEEENFTSEKVNIIAGRQEQLNIVEKLAAHGRINSGPGPLALPFMFYNLDGKDRELFMIPFPWIVRKVLVPIIWKGQWKAMRPFLLQ
jgi:hemerythrin-like domain-containing protein